MIGLSTTIHDGNLCGVMARVNGLLFNIWAKMFCSQKLFGQISDTDSPGQVKKAGRQPGWYEPHPQSMRGI